MSIVKRVSANTLYIAVSDILNKFLSFFLFIYFARILGDEKVGLYSFALGFGTIFLILADLGVTGYFSRSIASERKRIANHISTMMSLKFVLLLPVFLIFVLLVLLLKRDVADSIIIIIIFASMLVKSLSHVFAYAFQAMEKMQYAAVIYNTERFLFVGSAIALLYLGFGLMEISVALLAASVIALAAGNMIYSRKVKDFAGPVKVSFAIPVKNLIRNSLAFALIAIVAEINFQIDIVILSILQGDAATGWYSVAVRLYEVLIAFAVYFTGAVYPIMCLYAEKNGGKSKEKNAENIADKTTDKNSKNAKMNSTIMSTKQKLLQELYSKGVKYLFMMALPLAVFVFISSSRLINFFYKGQFDNSAIILSIICWAVIVKALQIYTLNMLNAVGKEKTVLKALAIAAVTNICLNLLLIPLFPENGGIGAAIATMCSEMLALGIMYYGVKNNKLEIYFAELIRPSIAAAIMGILAYNLLHLHILILLPIAAIAYICMLLATQSLDSRDIGYIRQILARGKPERHGITATK